MFLNKFLGKIMSKNEILGIHHLDPKKQNTFR
jgi:hypothetical protein